MRQQVIPELGPQVVAFDIDFLLLGVIGDDTIADLKIVDGQIDNVLSVQARVGAGMNRLETASSRLAEIEESTTSMLSNTEDADMAEVITNYSTQQAVYQSALNAGARIVQTSLLDFLH